ncbi:hypothetical protein C8Q76DRAFT_697902 [Earliella scabrosa]|nr:hypothetical protein C8Q76DRAFT_697902 [Earliella scabrosa]
MTMIHNPRRLGSQAINSITYLSVLENWDLRVMVGIALQALQPRVGVLRNAQGMLVALVCSYFWEGLQTIEIDPGILQSDQAEHTEDLGDSQLMRSYECMIKLWQSRHTYSRREKQRVEESSIEEHSREGDPRGSRGRATEGVTQAYKNLLGSARDGLARRAQVREASGDFGSSRVGSADGPVCKASAVASAVVLLVVQKWGALTRCWFAGFESSSLDGRGLRSNMVIEGQLSNKGFVGLKVFFVKPVGDNLMVVLICSDEYHRVFIVRVFLKPTWNNADSGGVSESFCIWIADYLSLEQEEIDKLTGTNDKVLHVRVTLSVELLDVLNWGGERIKYLAGAHYLPWICCERVPPKPLVAVAQLTDHGVSKEFADNVERTLRAGDVASDTPQNVFGRALGAVGSPARSRYSCRRQSRPPFLQHHDNAQGISPLGPGINKVACMRTRCSAAGRATARGRMARMRIGALGVQLAILPLYEASVTGSSTNSEPL